MTEPIALVILNNGIPYEEENEYIRSIITERLEGYRTLIVFQDKPEKDIVTIQVFNGDSISDVQFEELKSIITNIFEE